MKPTSKEMARLRIALIEQQYRDTETPGYTLNCRIMADLLHVWGPAYFKARCGDAEIVVKKDEAEDLTLLYSERGVLHPE